MPFHLARRLFYFSRTPLGGRIVGGVFSHFSGLLPVDVLLRTRRVLCFRHPAPVDPSHSLVVPKRVLPTLLALSRTAETRSYFVDVLRAASQVAPRIGVPGAHGFTISCNGGGRQDVRQVHFHIQMGREAPLPTADPTAPLVLEDGDVQVRHLEDSPAGLELELALPALPGDVARLSPDQARSAAEALRLLPRLDERFALTARGYTLRVDERSPRSAAPGAPFVLRISAGPLPGR